MDGKSTPDSKKKSSKMKKPKKDSTDDESVSDLVIAEDTSPSSSKNKTMQVNKPLLPNNTNSTNKKRKKRDSASSDEERWLTAIESGKLEDVDDELKKIKPKDPALMTARQRAIYDRGSDGTPAVTAPTLMSLPTGYKEKVMTAEAIQKAAIKSQKRKQLADEKREKDKKKTMERLLKKQESKALKSAKAKSSRSAEPVITYTQNIYSTIVHCPIEVEYPLKAATIKDPPKPKLCEMGCGNLRKYSCSRTGVSLCSYICYKRNITQRII